MALTVITVLFCRVILVFACCEFELRRAISFLTVSVAESLEILKLLYLS